MQLFKKAGDLAALHSSRPNATCFDCYTVEILSLSKDRYESDFFPNPILHSAANHFESY